MKKILLLPIFLFAVAMITAQPIYKTYIFYFKVSGDKDWSVRVAKCDHLPTSKECSDFIIKVFGNYAKGKTVDVKMIHEDLSAASPDIRDTIKAK